MRGFFRFLKILFGILSGYLVAQQLWVLWNLLKNSPQQTLLSRANQSDRGISFRETKRRKAYTLRHVVEDGIERISYIPRQPRFETPILMLHGMFHAAWCWEFWQTRLAELGWESHAISLPGHGTSPGQRPVHLCTLDYYLNFVRDEVSRFERKPVLLGHSMGGALVQWYLRYIGDDLPGVVLVSSWVSHSEFADGLLPLLRLDPAILPLTILSWDASSWVRSPDRAAEKFLSPQAVVSPEWFHARLGPESALVVYQHNPPFWSPAGDIQTPMLILAGEEDAVVSKAGLQRTAAHYQADFALVEKAAHNLMLEHNWQESLEMIDSWLRKQKIA